MVRCGARLPLLGKFARGVPRATPFILPANVHDQGFRSLSFDFEGGYQGIFPCRGGAFAKQYMDDQVSAHKDAVSLFERYGNGGHEDKLKAWATQTLPTFQHHLDMAQNIYGNM